MVTTFIIKQLYQHYVKENPTNAVSLRTFFALKLFYVHSATSKDIEVCVCKKHLHAQWAVQALIDCSRKQHINLRTITSYESFFQYLYADCHQEEKTYISWTSTPGKKTICSEIEERWKNFKQQLLHKDDGITSVSMQHFETLDTTTKNWKEVKRLKAVSTRANLEFILNFIEQFLRKIIHHGNHWWHYHNTIKDFREHFDALIMDIDFSENLFVPVKYEPQSLHWSYPQIIVHSGLVRYNGEKSYHPYLSSDRNHDHNFVKCAIEEILSELNLKASTTIIIKMTIANCNESVLPISQIFKI